MPPQAFDNCVKGGGRVRTKKLSNGRYMKICFLKGKSYAGHVKKAKGKSKGRKGTPPMLAAMRAHKKR